MKVIFDTEEQKNEILYKVFAETCPHRVGLESSDCMSVGCKECWETAMEVEVKNGID